MAAETSQEAMKGFSLRSTLAAKKELDATPWVNDADMAKLLFAEQRKVKATWKANKEVFCFCFSLNR